MVMRYLHGNAARPSGPGLKIIAHIVNNQGGWGKGFVLALNEAWPTAGQQYRKWFQARQGFVLGAVQYVRVGPEVIVANMLAQDGYAHARRPHPVHLQALDTCLKSVGTMARGWKASVHMPRIGCGHGGCRWREVEPLIQRRLEGVPVMVYLLEPIKKTPGAR